MRNSLDDVTHQQLVKRVDGLAPRLTAKQVYRVLTTTTDGHIDHRGPNGGRRLGIRQVAILVWLKHGVFLSPQTVLDVEVRALAKIRAAIQRDREALGDEPLRTLERRPPSAPRAPGRDA